MWQEVIDRLARGQLGIVPTDTLYGLTGDASSSALIERIYALKCRRSPVSVVPPNLKWVQRRVQSHYAPRLDDAPSLPWGTWLIPAKAPTPSRTPAQLTQSGYLGVRRTPHYITTLAAVLGRPLTSTSVNVTRRPPMTDLYDLDPEVARGVDFCVYEGPRSGAASPLTHFGPEGLSTILRA